MISEIDSNMNIIVTGIDESPCIRYWLLQFSARIVYTFPFSSGVYRLYSCQPKAVKISFSYTSKALQYILKSFLKLQTIGWGNDDKKKKKER